MRRLTKGVTLTCAARTALTCAAQRTCSQPPRPPAAQRPPSPLAGCRRRCCWRCRRPRLLPGQAERARGASGQACAGKVHSSINSKIVGPPNSWCTHTCSCPRPPAPPPPPPTHPPTHPHLQQQAVLRCSNRGGRRRFLLRPKAPPRPSPAPAHQPSCTRRAAQAWQAALCVSRSHAPLCRATAAPLLRLLLLPATQHSSTASTTTADVHPPSNCRPPAPGAQLRRRELLVRRGWVCFGWACLVLSSQPTVDLLWR